jgi:hypothetical protein
MAKNGKYFLKTNWVIAWLLKQMAHILFGIENTIKNVRVFQNISVQLEFSSNTKIYQYSCRRKHITEPCKYWPSPTRSSVHETQGSQH